MFARLYQSVIAVVFVCTLLCRTLLGDDLPDAPGQSFSLVVIPDTQQYRPVESASASWRNEVFQSYTRWIVDNLGRQNIVFVTHVGDIVDRNELGQWQVACECMDRLHGRVPYGISVGNHDMTSDGDSSLFQQTFPKSRYESFSWYGGSFQSGLPGPAVASGNNANSFQLFASHGMKFLILHLECNAPDDVLAWADQVLQVHQERRAIVTTHMGLGPRDRPQTPDGYFDLPKGRMTWKKCHGEQGNSPQQMWEKCFRKHRNLFLICCGDQSRTQAMRQASVGDHGNTVHEVLSDYGSNGLRLMRFCPDEQRIEVRTWNPMLERLTLGTKIVPDANEHQFELPYAMETGVAKISKDEDALRFEVIRKIPIPAESVQQGIGTDGEFLYLQTTNRLVKYDLAGERAAIGEKLSYHHGGITVHDGKIYCAVSECKKVGTKRHWIKIYDCESLKLLASHDVGQHFTVCAGGIAHRDGHFFVAESFFDDDHDDRIVEFDASFRHLRSHQIKFRSPYGIQGLEYLPATDQFQIQSHGRRFYRIDSDFESASLRLGEADIELQDLALMPGENLLINHRKGKALLVVRVVSAASVSR